MNNNTNTINSSGSISDSRIPSETTQSRRLIVSHDSAKILIRGQLSTKKIESDTRQV
jgi:hypothetical protein